MSNTLTSHFATLKLYQKVLRLIGIVVTILNIIGLVYIMDTYPSPLPVIITVIGTLFMWYGIFNTIIIVNFLFELDKNKANKN
jgi:uncharacterized membrane protein YsdA (DUF1294 family)|tara:strand:- start:75 stop:323 length:249 start_codon:yes stop_codon:yes gene_type:complete